MKKKDIKVVFKTPIDLYEFSAKGLFDEKEQKITYIDNDVNKTKIVLDLNNNILIRENKELYLVYKYIDKEITNNEIRIKDMNKSINVKIKTNNIIKTDNKFKVEYSLEEETEKYVYEINY